MTTTANMLGRYRRELLSEGFDEEQAFTLVQMAARTVVEVDGVAVRTDDATTQAD